MEFVFSLWFFLCETPSFKQPISPRGNHHKRVKFWFFGTKRESYGSPLWVDARTQCAVWLNCDAARTLVLRRFHLITFHKSQNKKLWSHLHLRIHWMIPEHTVIDSVLSFCTGTWIGLSYLLYRIYCLTKIWILLITCANLIPWPTCCALFDVILGKSILVLFFEWNHAQYCDMSLGLWKTFVWKDLFIGKDAAKQLQICPKKKRHVFNANTWARTILTSSWGFARVGDFCFSQRLAR